MTTKRWIFIGVISAIALFWAWYLFVRIDKKKAIQIIAKNSSDADKSVLANFGEDYLIARAKAFKAKQTSFELNGKMYNTQTGKGI